MFILRARVVAPLTAPPIKDGAVALDGPLIVDWGPVRRIVSQYGPANEINLTDCLLLPGFINAHTHLELSYLKDRITYHHDFIEWIDTVRRSRCETFPPGLSDEVYKQVMS